MTRSRQLAAVLLVSGGLAMASGPALGAQSCSAFHGQAPSGPVGFSDHRGAEDQAAQEQADAVKRAARIKARAAKRAARAAGELKAASDSFDSGHRALSPASCHAQF